MKRRKHFVKNFGLFQENKMGKKQKGNGKPTQTQRMKKNNNNNNEITSET